MFLLARYGTPTVQMIFQKVNEKTEGTDYAFSYELTSLKKLLKMIGFHFCKTNNHTVLMEIPRIAARRYEYLRKIRNVGQRVFYQFLKTKLGTTLTTLLKKHGHIILVDVTPRNSLQKEREL